MAPEIHWVQVLLDLDDGSKNVTYPNKIEVLFNFCFVMFLPSHMVEAAEPLQPHSDNPGPQIRGKVTSQRIKPDQVHYWEGSLQLYFCKLSLKMIHHSCRSTWGPHPSRSRLWVHKSVMPP